MAGLALGGPDRQHLTIAPFGNYAPPWSWLKKPSDAFAVIQCICLVVMFKKSKGLWLCLKNQ
jgi:hypothetical protein